MSEIIHEVFHRWQRRGRGILKQASNKVSAQWDAGMNKHEWGGDSKYSCAGATKQQFSVQRLRQPRCAGKQANITAKTNEARFKTRADVLLSSLQSFKTLILIYQYTNNIYN